MFYFVFHGTRTPRGRHLCNSTVATRSSNSAGREMITEHTHEREGTRDIAKTSSPDATDSLVHSCLTQSRTQWEGARPPRPLAIPQCKYMCKQAPQMQYCIEKSNSEVAVHSHATIPRYT